MVCRRGHKQQGEPRNGPIRDNIAACLSSHPVHTTEFAQDNKILHSQSLSDCLRLLFPPAPEFELFQSRLDRPDARKLIPCSDGSKDGAGINTGLHCRLALALASPEHHMHTCCRAIFMPLICLAAASRGTATKALQAIACGPVCSTVYQT